MGGWRLKLAPDLFRSGVCDEARDGRPRGFRRPRNDERTAGQCADDLRTKPVLEGEASVAAPYPARKPDYFRGNIICPVHDNVAVPGVGVACFKAVEAHRKAVLSVISLGATVDAERCAVRSALIGEDARITVVGRAFGSFAVSTEIGLDMAVPDIEQEEPGLAGFQVEISNRPVPGRHRSAVLVPELDQGFHRRGEPVVRSELAQHRL